MQGIPKPLVLDALSRLMQDPRYFDGNHPEHGRYVAFMKAGFETALTEDDEENQGRGPTAGSETAEIQQLSPGERALVIIELLKRNVARRHGIGPDGPVDRRSSDVEPARPDDKAAKNKRLATGTVEDVSDYAHDKSNRMGEKWQRDRLIRGDQEAVDKRRQPEPRPPERQKPRPGGGNAGFPPKRRGNPWSPRKVWE